MYVVSVKQDKNDAPRYVGMNVDYLETNLAARDLAVVFQTLDRAEEVAERYRRRSREWSCHWEIRVEPLEVDDQTKPPGLWQVLVAQFESGVLGSALRQAFVRTEQEARTKALEWVKESDDAIRNNPHLSKYKLVPGTHLFKEGVIENTQGWIQGLDDVFIYYQKVKVEE